MARRGSSYDKMIATKMLDPESAIDVILHSLEFDDNIEEALRLTITSMGIKEFSEKSAIPVQNVSGFVRGKRNFGYRTPQPLSSSVWFKVYCNEGQSSLIYQ